MAKCAVIQRHHLKLFAEFLEKLRKTPDGDVSLLDKVTLLFGGSISSSDRHTHGPLPIVYPEHTPLTNLQMTLLNKLSVPAEKLGDKAETLRKKQRQLFAIVWKAIPVCTFRRRFRARF
jgi:hypothetical protein